jgi:hypothetical protein
MSAASVAHTGPLSAIEFKRIHAWWRAANYVAAGARDRNVRAIIGPGHSGPALVANTWPSRPRFSARGCAMSSGSMPRRATFACGDPTRRAQTGWMPCLKRRNAPGWRNSSPPGSQRLLASGPRLPRCRVQQEGGRRSRLSSARRQYSAMRCRSMSAQP